MKDNSDERLSERFINAIATLEYIVACQTFL